MTNPLQSVPVKDRIRALESARARLIERYYACTEELAVCKPKLETIAGQLLALHGLDEEVDAAESADGTQ